MTTRRDVFWLIPVTTFGIFILVGHIVSTLEPITVTTILRPAGAISTINFPSLWYDTPGGPLASIILSNFVFDGISNFYMFMAYSAVFFIVSFTTSSRVNRAWTSVLVSFLAAFISMAAVRLIALHQQYVYGQSAVLAAFAGSTIFYFLYEAAARDGMLRSMPHRISTWTLRPQTAMAKALVEWIGFLMAGTFGILVAWGFYSYDPIVLFVHGSAMVIGATLTALLTVVIPRTKGKATSGKPSYL